MTIKIVEGLLAIIRLELSPSDIAPLLDKHAHHYGGSALIEHRGRSLIEAGFPPHDASQFVRAVCEWGNGHRNVGRVLSDNTADDIAKALREGWELAQKDEVARGVHVIGELRQLGQSFASKQLRFLVPDRAVILDDVIRSALGYRATVEGYNAFLADCQDILSYCRKSDELDSVFRVELRVCDIEAALFAKVQGY